MSSPTEHCRICNSTSNYLFHAKVMDKYNVAYYRCGNCDFIQTEKPYWLEESYKSPINFSDTGILLRNLDLARPVSMLLYFVFGKEHKYLDYAGGYGLFTRLMRDAGFDYYWHDPYTPNLVARGFEIDPMKDQIEAITTFESFEHLAEPMPEIEQMLRFSRNIIFSTRLVPDPLPQPDQWWYYGLEHGQHVALYSRRTLQYIADQFGLKLNTVKHFHMLSEKKVNPLLFKVLYYAGKVNADKLLHFVLKSKTEEDNREIVRRQSKARTQGIS
jgi:hypothetical protein